MDCSYEKLLTRAINLDYVVVINRRRVSGTDRKLEHWTQAVSRQADSTLQSTSTSRYVGKERSLRGGVWKSCVCVSFACGRKTNALTLETVEVQHYIIYSFLRSVISSIVLFTL